MGKDVGSCNSEAEGFAGFPGLAILVRDRVRDQLLNRDSSQVANKASLVSPFFWGWDPVCARLVTLVRERCVRELLHMTLPLGD